MKESYIPEDHIRAKSLKLREKLANNVSTRVVVEEGLIAHGRGEAFDYLIGERTIPPAIDAIRAAAASLILAHRPVISVNGNLAALSSISVAKLSEITKSKVEVNLFHRSAEREYAIMRILKEAGVIDVLGLEACSTIPEIGSDRRKVDSKGILISDLVLLSLEDGDRTDALVNMGKKVIVIDLNPISRSAKRASITIVDNVVRAMPKLVNTVSKLRGLDENQLLKIVESFNNHINLALTLNYMIRRLTRLAKGEMGVQ